MEALRDFVGSDGTKRVAGDEWIEFGPKLYIPRVEVQFIRNIEPYTIKSNEGLKVRARRQTKDDHGNERQAGEEWIIRSQGFYIPGNDEEVVDTVKGYIIDDTHALLLLASQTFVDVYGKTRKAGEEWLVTSQLANVHIIDVYERYVSLVNITILSEDEFCYVLNPLDEKGQN